MYFVRDICIIFEKYMWFELGKSMWNRYRGIYQVHVKYIHNDIVKTFRVVILQYADCICDMHDISKYLPSPLINGGGL